MQSSVDVPLVAAEDVARLGMWGRVYTAIDHMLLASRIRIKHRPYLCPPWKGRAGGAVYYLRRGEGREVDASSSSCRFSPITWGGCFANARTRRIPRRRAIRALLVEGGVTRWDAVSETLLFARRVMTTSIKRFLLPSMREYGFCAIALMIRPSPIKALDEEWSYCFGFYSPVRSDLFARM